MMETSLVHLMKEVEMAMEVAMKDRAMEDQAIQGHHLPCRPS